MRRDAARAWLLALALRYAAGPDPRLQTEARGWIELLLRRRAMP